MTLDLFADGRAADRAVRCDPADGRRRRDLRRHVDAPTEAGAGGHRSRRRSRPCPPPTLISSRNGESVNLQFAAGTLQVATAIAHDGVRRRPGVTLDPAQAPRPGRCRHGPRIYWRVDDVLNQLTSLSAGYLWNINYSRVLSMRPSTVDAGARRDHGRNRVALGDLTVTPSTEHYANRRAPALRRRPARGGRSLYRRRRHRHVHPAQLSPE